MTKRFSIFVLVSVFLAMTALLVYAGAGELDTTFGTGGITTTNINGSDEANAVSVQSDGKIIVGGYSGTPRRFTLVRYNSNGALDTTFGTSGIVTTTLGGSDDSIYAISILSDDKIIAAGRGGKNSEFGMARYNGNGTLDTTFGTSGIITTNIGSTNDYAREISVLPDGKILLGGSGGSAYNAILVRYNSNGSLDTTFGTGGITNTDFGGSSDSINGMHVLSDGKIIVASSGGSANFDMVVARYNSNGALDTTFGTNGITQIDFGNNDYSYGLAIQNDGKIVVVGTAYKNTSPTDNLLGIARLNSDGSLDGTFGTSGKASMQFSNAKYTYARSVFCQSDGKILVSGYTDGIVSGTKDYFLARLNSNGSLDSAFGTDGATVTNLGTSKSDYGYRGLYQEATNTYIIVGSSGGDFSIARYSLSSGPTNPTTVTEDGGATSGAWQNSVSDPAFTWSGATDGGSGAGIKNYDTYWGQSITGTTVSAVVVSAAYDPPATADGTYYLRLRTRDNNDAVSDWATAFTFKYDGVAPTLPITATETAHGCTGWCNDLDVAFSWAAASDGSGSGQKHYDIYWGSDPAGSSATLTQTGTTYDPVATDGSPHYLRLRATDNAGNASAWATLFAYQYDGDAPSNPTEATEASGITSGDWGSGVPVFTLSGGNDADSGLAGYYYYFGPSASGTPATFSAGSIITTTAPSSTGVYYLRVQAVDNAGNNAGDMADLFTLNYDATPPTAPAGAVESHGIISGTWANTAPSFTLSGGSDADSGLAGYNYYFGPSASGIPATFSADPVITPTLGGDGTYYLRVTSEDEAGNESGATDLFTFRYDTAAPTNPSATENHAAVSDVWQNSVDTPSFTLSGAADGAGSGVESYDLYWGTSATGSTATTHTTASGYTIPAAVTAGTYHLRVRTYDQAGNTSVWQTAFTLKYDDIAPGNPNAVIETGGTISGTWQSTVSSPSFSWNAAIDNIGGSGTDGYNVYWGDDPAGDMAVTQVSTSAFVPGGSVPAGTPYYLRLQAADKAGNTAAWMTVFVFKYDLPPSNPTAVIETGGAVSDIWQNTVNSPAFTWSGATGGGASVASYDIYWGPDGAGTTTVTTTTGAAYTPGVVANGTYYLRLRTRNSNGQLSGWETVFTFKFDNAVPVNPTAVTEASGVVSGTWQTTVGSPAFSWSGATDTGSGVESYDVYWGTNAAGTSVTSNVTVPAYAPGDVTPGTPYYLRLRTLDAVGNASAWTTAFTFKYDLPPTNPTAVIETGGAVSDVWQNTVNSPAFTWSGATGGGASVASYDVYWGGNSTGTTIITTTTGAAYTPGVVANGTYYLRLRTRNSNGQLSDWETGFIFRFDNTPPTQVSRIDVNEASDAPDGVWQSATGDASFAWPVTNDTHSGVAKYRVYWGTEANGTSVTEQTAATYDPPAFGNGTRYLRLKIYDYAGNSTQWQTLFEFKYDNSAPTLTLESPAFYPAALSFDVRWAVTDAESGPANCTVTWATDSRSGYLANNQPYNTVKTAQHFENLGGVEVGIEATCGNQAGLSTVMTSTTTIVAPIADTDSDEIPSAWETDNGLDPANPSDGNGDPDSDELTNLQEYQHGTDPNQADTDSDGLSDYDEVYSLWAAGRVSGSTALSADASTTPIWWDSDGDSIGDGLEVAAGTNPLDDHDPYSPDTDTDNDGLPDGWETYWNYNPNDPADAVRDTDGDSLTALDEYQYHTSPLLDDTDGDGLEDAAEINTYGTDPNSWDTDRDRFPDASEVSGATDPTDGNQSPMVSDMDTDGMNDDWEHQYQVTDPAGDPDGDGLTNLQEYQAGTNPNQTDTDGDGYNDKSEIDAGTDPADPASTPAGPPDNHIIYLPMISRN